MQMPDFLEDRIRGRRAARSRRAGDSKAKHFSANFSEAEICTKCIFDRDKYRIPLDAPQMP